MFLYIKKFYILFCSTRQSVICFIGYLDISILFINKVAHRDRVKILKSNFIKTIVEHLLPNNWMIQWWIDEHMNEKKNTCNSLTHHMHTDFISIFIYRKRFLCWYGISLIKKLIEIIYSITIENWLEFSLRLFFYTCKLQYCWL